MLQIDISNPYDSNFGFSLSDKHNVWKEKYCNGEFVPLFRCTIGCNELSIDYKGNMNACTSYTEYGGNLLKEDLLSIWQRFINIKNESISINNKCVKCDAIYYCNNCPADQKAYYGDAEKVNEILCLFAKAKKMYYKDKMELTRITEQLKLNSTK
jgi:radical SAM protein with 4Fe4S-binding SPASM domain